RLSDVADHAILHARCLEKIKCPHGESTPPQFGNDSLADAARGANDQHPVGCVHAVFLLGIFYQLKSPRREPPARRAPRPLPAAVFRPLARAPDIVGSETKLPCRLRVPEMRTPPLSCGRG